MEYLLKVAERITESDDRVMSSLTIPLKTAAEGLGPLCWVTVERGALDETRKLADANMAEDEEATEELLLTIFSCIRIKMAHANAVASVTKRLKEKLTEMGADNPELTIHEWAGKPDFIKMASAFDAFWWIKPTGKYSSAKMGTLTLRGRGSAALSSTVAILKPLGMNLAGLAEWIWQRDALIQFIYLLDPLPAEMAKTESYVHYITGFGLATRNPYSMTINPDLYTLVHVVGNTLGTPRSLNAILPKEGVHPMVFLNAAYIAYSAWTSGEFQGGFQVPTNAPNYEARVVEFQNAVDHRNTLGKHGTNWFLSSKDPVLKKAVMGFAATRWSALIGYRDGTIAKKLKSMAAGYIEIAANIPDSPLMIVGPPEE